eukprot:scaffold16041_cov90-Isochrysis_galbana.AAC.1
MAGNVARFDFGASCAGVRGSPEARSSACRRLSAYSPRGPWYTLYDRPVCVVRWMTTQPGRSGSTTAGDLAAAAAARAAAVAQADARGPSSGEPCACSAPAGAAGGSMAAAAAGGRGVGCARGAAAMQGPGGLQYRGGPPGVPQIAACPQNRSFTRSLTRGNTRKHPQAVGG